MSDAPRVERKYAGAAGYYSRYRPPYPPALVPVLRDAFRLDGKGQLLDLGSGPGSVAIPVAHLFERVVEAYLKRSRFSGQIEYSELFEVEWTVESLIGNLYSMSFCNRKLLGEHGEAFERDLRRAVLALEPSGIFRGESHQFFALMAFKR